MAARVTTGSVSTYVGIGGTLDARPVCALNRAFRKALAVSGRGMSSSMSIGVARLLWAKRLILATLARRWRIGVERITVTGWLKAPDACLMK